MNESKYFARLAWTAWIHLSSSLQATTLKIRVIHIENLVENGFSFIAFQKYHQHRGDSLASYSKWQSLPSVISLLIALPRKIFDCPSFSLATENWNFLETKEHWEHCFNHQCTQLLHFYWEWWWTQVFRVIRGVRQFTSVIFFMLPNNGR